MVDNGESRKAYCKFCGSEINKDAQFCKMCGKNFTEEKDFINRINEKINILSVFIGLIVSVIVLLVGSSFFGVVIISKTMDATFYLFLILFAVLFLGGITTGILGNPKINEGLINGAVLSLVAFIIIGFIIGGYLLIVIGISSAMASAFSSYGPSAASNVTTTPTSPFSQENIFLILKGILIIITIFFGGMGGGALGSWIKGGTK